MSGTTTSAKVGNKVAALKTFPGRRIIAAQKTTRFALGLQF